MRVGGSIEVEEKTGLGVGRKPLPGRIKVLELCAVDFTIYHFLLPLGRYLRREYEVHFASSPGPYVEKIEQEGFRFHAMPLQRNYNLFAHARALTALERLMARERFHVVHTHTPVAALLGRVAARLSRVPVVLYTAHGFYFHDKTGTLRKKIFVTLEKLGGAFSDYIFTQSEEDFYSALDLGLIRKERIMQIGNGVDLDRFNPERLGPMRGQIRRKLGVYGEQPVVCVTGRLVREKGYFELIDAFARLVCRIPDALLLVVGGVLESDYDDAAKEIKRRVVRAGLRDKVRFLSFREDVEEILCASDLFVLPSHREGMPRSILEAMAMGLPVVATNIRGSREEVEDGVSGVLVEVGDIEALSEAISSLLCDPARRLAMGARARKRAREFFDENLVIEKQAKVIDRLLREKGFKGP